MHRQHPTDMRNTEKRPDRNATQAMEKSMHPSPRARADLRIVAPRPASVALASASDFQRDLSRYWRYVRGKGELGLTARGWIYKTVFKSLLAALNEAPGGPDSEQEHPRLFFMRQLLIGLREMVNQPGALTAQPDGRFFQLPLPARIKQSFETWRDTLEMADVASAPKQAGQSRALLPNSLPAAIKTRMTVLRALARAEKTAALEQSLGHGTHTRWMSVAALLDAVARADTAGHPDAAEQATTRSLHAGHARLIDRSAVLSMLAGPLHWLGLVDLGYDNPDADAATPAGPLPAAYRLTDTGLWLLDLAEAPRYVESGGRVLVQPNFTILAMQPISDRVLMDLDQFADLQGGDRATTYQLTRQSVYRGQRAGWDAQRIASFLEAHQGAPLPPNIRRTLDEWQAQHHRIVFHRDARVVQFADDAARTAITDVLARAGIEPVALGPAHALVESGVPAATLIKTLSDAGWMPEVSPARQTSAERDETEGCLRLVLSEETPDSFDVKFKQPTPSLFALGQLAALTGPVAPGQPLQITAAGVRAALSAGMTMDEILATLAHLHDGPLPLPVEQHIRDWARFFGRATANTVCLFEFSHQDVLNNLLDDDAIACYLRPIEGSAQPVAVVDAAHADAVREMLAERGIEITA